MACDATVAFHPYKVAVVGSNPAMPIGAMAER